MKYLKNELVDREGRDTSKGPNYISKRDLVEFLAKFFHKYTDKEKIREAIMFFDMDKDGQILPLELESMLNSFAKTEEAYLKPQEIQEIIRQGKKSSVAGQI